MSEAEAVTVGTEVVKYAERGWAIFPCHWPVWVNGQVRCSCQKPDCKDIGKHPRTARGHKDATADRARAAAYWARWPLSNIGLATGAMNGITVVDIDPRHGGDRSLVVLEQEHGPLPPTFRNRTGSGGEHIFFEYVPGVGCSASELGPGIDVKSDGGYVIAPPSQHQSGNFYSTTAALGFAQAPQWLIDKLVKKGRERSSVSPEYWRAMWAAGAEKGARDSTLIRMAGYLLRRRLDPLLVLDMMQMWNRERFLPPLSPREVIKDVNSICGSELRKRGI
jgi:hypothetical protein